MTGTVTVTGTGGGEPGQAAAPTTAPSGSTATTVKERTTTTRAAPSAPGTSVDLVAKAVEWDKKSLTLKANSPVVIHFDNKDTLPHNVDITTQEGGGTTIFKQDPFTGPQEVDYRFTTPGPGKLYFVCDVHPNMKGTINVT